MTSPTENNPMMINNLKDLEEAKQMILDMKAQATSEFVIDVFQKMLDQLSIGDVENMYNPVSLSVEYFGYNIFETLHRI